MKHMGKGETTVRWFSLVQSVAGFLIGFVFFGICYERLTSMFTESSIAIPAEFPSVMAYLASFGAVGVIILLVLLWLGIKFIKKFLPFITGLIVGMLLAVIVTSVLPALGLPDPFSWAAGLMGIEEGGGAV